MKIREIMSTPVVRIHPDEPVEVAARALTHYNVGAMPVCGSDGRLCGMVTDRDLVIRCMAAGKSPERTAVEQIMTTGLTVAAPNMETSAAAALMGRMQVRRLPVVENGKLCGMVSLGDLANRKETDAEAGKALSEISNHLSQRD